MLKPAFSRWKRSLLKGLALFSSQLARAGSGLCSKAQLDVKAPLSKGPTPGPAPEEETSLTGQPVQCLRASIPDDPSSYGWAPCKTDIVVRFPSPVPYFWCHFW